MYIQKLVVTLFMVGLLALPGAALSAREIVLEVWQPFDPATSVDAVAREELYRQYEQLNPGIKIKPSILEYGDLHEKLVVAGAARRGPDIVHMLGEWVPEFVRMGIINDVTDQAMAWEDREYFPQSTWDVATQEDRIYGIPSIASPRVLLYREDYLKQAGFDGPPESWEEMIEVAKRITESIPGVYGFAYCSSTKAIRGPQEFLPFLWQTGAEWVIYENGEWKPGFTVAQAEEVFQLYLDLLPSTPSDSIGWEYLEMDNSFVVGQSAMCHNGSWMQIYADRAGEAFQHWRGAPMPANQNRATYFEVKVDGVGAFSNHKEEAWKFLSWLMGKDQMARHSRHDNLPSRTDVIALPEFQEDEWKKPFFEVIADGKSFPPIPMSESNKAMMTKLQEVLCGQKTPFEAAEELLAFLENHLVLVNQ